MQRLTGSIVLLDGWRRVVLALAAGALAALGQAPFDFPLVCFVSFPVLVWLIDGSTAPADARLLGRLKPAFAAGWQFGFGYFLAGLWWVGSAMLYEGDTYAWALPFVVLGLPFLLAFFYGFAAALARLLWSEGLGRVFALAFAFGVAEWLREFLFTGFPWNPVGFAAMPAPMLKQSAGLVGTIGMNTLAVLVFSLPAALSGPRGRKLASMLALLLIGAHVAYGAYATSRPAPADMSGVSVRVVQPSIDLSRKWDAANRDQVFKKLMDLSARPPAQGAARPQLIVWPETSMPFLLSERPDALSAIGALLEDDQQLLAGVVRQEGADAGALYYNSIVAINSNGEIVDAVDKIHLVPFGEYLPFSDLFAALGVNQIVGGPMNYVAGARRHAIAAPGGLAAIPYICYEIIFPALMPSPAPAKSFIVTITNDAWFGVTPGPYQHLRQAQVRAVETGLAVVRSANTGMSAVIDARGRIVDALALNAVGTIDAVVTAPNAERSVYLRNRLAGVALLLLVGLCALLSALVSNVRKN